MSPETASDSNGSSSNESVTAQIDVSATAPPLFSTTIISKPTTSTPTPNGSLVQQRPTNHAATHSDSSLNSPLALSPFISPLVDRTESLSTAEDLDTAVEQLTNLLEQQLIPLTLLDSPDNDIEGDIEGNIESDIQSGAIVADFLTTPAPPPLLDTVSLSDTVPLSITATGTLTGTPTGTQAEITNTFASYLPLIMVVPPAVTAPDVPFQPMPPLPTPDSTLRVVNVPILMYHYLSVPPAGSDIYRRDLSVAPDLFARHLDSMLEAGYQTISLYELTMHLTIGAPLPAKPVIITFDDGYRDNYENAFPLLLARGMTATFFVSPEFIDLKRAEYADWSMLRAMYGAGMSIEAHGLNHRSLKNRDVDFLAWQALASIQAIERELGQRPRFVSYPAGEYDNLTVEVFRNSHFWAGVTTVQGSTQRSDAPFALRRVRVRGSTQPNELIRLMELDW